MRYGVIGLCLVTACIGLWFQTSASNKTPLNSSSAHVSTESLLRADCSHPANEVVAENCLPGTENWQQENSINIQIYSSKDSINVGEKLDFFVDSDSSTFDLNIYRMGYYGGLGARLMQSVPDLTGEKQPNCVRMSDTGLRTCSNWQVSYSLNVPLDWVSGIYMAQVKDMSSNISNETVFAIRQDERKSNMLYQMSVTTFQAYNNYDGKSIYSENSSTCDTVADAPRAVKVSLNRPYNAALWDPNYFFHTEYPMVRWLEQQGYDVTYSTNMDTHRSGKPGAHNALLDHKVFMSVGHDEYWSQEMRDAIQAARDAGVNIGFFGGNIGYWRVRFEPDPVTDEPDSIMVAYKTTESGSPDPSGDPTTTWRDPLGANQPENAIVGQMYVGYNLNIYFPLRLSSEYTSDPLFRHTGLQNMPSNTYLDVAGQHQVMGWEWDAVVDNGVSPRGLQVLAKTSVYGYLLQDAGSIGNGNLQKAVVNVARYTAPSGAIVFASGTIQWAQGLGVQDVDNMLPPDPYISQITYNLFSDMGVQPTTPDTTLILDGSHIPDPPLPTDRIKTVGSVKEPTISDIQVTSGDNGSTIKWKTDVESTGQVWYGTLPDHIINMGGVNTDYSTDHQFTLAKLRPGQMYYLKVVSVNRDWEIAISDGTTFTTATASFTQNARNAIQPLITQGGCWVRDNRSGAVLFLVLVVEGGMLLIIAVISILRHRHRNRVLAGPYK